MSLKKIAKKTIGESRIWCYRSKSMDQLRSLMMGYFWEDKIVEKYFNINTTKTSKDFTDMTTLQKKKKKAYMRHFEATVATGRMDIYGRVTKSFLANIEQSNTHTPRKNWVLVCSKILS